MNTVLIIAAHPDDEILGIGGTSARHIAHGDDVHILICATGLTSRGSVSDEALQSLRQTCILANQMLFITETNIHFENFPDNKMDTVARLDVIKIVESYIQRIKPNIVYTHHASDVNIDHRILHDAVITACRPQPLLCVRKILCFETVSSTEWQSYALPPFIPNYYVDISDYLSIKIKALSIYEEEMRGFPHARSLKAVECLAALRGAQVGLHASEAFMLVRNVV